MCVSCLLLITVREPAVHTMTTTTHIDTYIDAHNHKGTHTERERERVKQTDTLLIYLTRN